MNQLPPRRKFEPGSIHFPDTDCQLSLGSGGMGGWSGCSLEISLTQQQLISRQVNIKYRPSFFTRALQNLRFSLGNHTIRIIASIVHFTPLCRSLNSFKLCLTFIFSIYQYSRHYSKCVWGEERAGMLDTSHSKQPMDIQTFYKVRKMGSYFLIFYEVASLSLTALQNNEKT